MLSSTYEPGEKDISKVRIGNLLLNRRCTVSIDVHSNGKLNFYSNPVKLFEDCPLLIR